MEEYLDIVGICRIFLIAGRVQGVRYRAATQQQAATLGITGQVRNLADGRVEVLACGTEQQLEALEQWLWQGPPQALVESIEVSEVEYRTLGSFEKC